MASSNELKEKLDLIPGSVSPFALLNNQDKDVELDIQRKILNANYIGVHSNDNTATAVLKIDDLISFFDKKDYRIRILDL